MSAQSEQGVIERGVGGFYFARDAAGRQCVLRAPGVFRRRGITPLVGDRIRFTPPQGEDEGWIEEILPRDNELVRPPVANIRHLVFVLAPSPAPDFILLDTMLVLAHRQRIAPVIVVNKCDMEQTLAETLRADYTHAGVPVLAVSAQQGDGLPALAAVLREGICCFAGQSGVGKSTLLSAVTGLALPSGEISRRIMRGKNTTRHAELYTSNGFQVLDTAGFSLLDLWDRMEPLALKSFYPEFAAYESQCRFQPCYHLSEPGCAVLSAMRTGDLPAARVARYHQLLFKVKEAWRKRYE
jgi:ribosome biogenesis GTPase